jgi:hypothetical protein
MSKWDWIWGIGLIAIGLIGGVLVGGVAMHKPAYLVAGIACIGIGILALVTANKAQPSGADQSFYAVVNFRYLSTVGWIILIALVIIMFGALLLMPR